MHFFTLKNSAILSVTAALYLTACTHTAQASNVVKTVTNGALTFELEFEDELYLEGGKELMWNEALQQPYIEAANQWLTALVGVEGKPLHTIRMRISVAEMNDGNGYAGPDSEEQIGDYEIPTSGTLVIGNHTYEQGFEQVEFKANILHEMGHILGIGSYTERFTEYSEELQGNVLKVPHSMAAQKYNQIYGNSYQYVPISDDGGHLYDYVLQEDKKRVLDNGKVLAPLTQEFMANGVVFGAVTLGVLDDIGYQVSYSGAEGYKP
ncbi:leishmanolysin-related zinc metalloendopeptidase [Moritella dasanensis]|uniref:leishmanolysin-related zinc metalloendopeptidase n=1 Tax=Moritella dasanensis TaxID=428031 RepID=UPI0002E0BEF6|nr:leishmanolysin-related zinc metalloendopeptidase [Moritella dasanensis]